MPIKNYFVVNLDRAKYGRNEYEPDKTQCIIKGYALKNGDAVEPDPDFTLGECFVLAINRDLLKEYAGFNTNPAFYQHLNTLDESGFLDPNDEYCGLVMRPVH